MADGNSVGKISLDLEVQSDITRQVSNVAGMIGKNLKASLEGATSSAFSGLKTNLNTGVASLKESLKKSLSGALAVAKNIKLPTPKFPQMSFTKPNNIDVPVVKQPRAPPTANIKAGNTEIIKSQMDNLAESLDITNAKIEQQQEKLLGLREAYNNTFNQERKNKLQEQILNTEATINKLTATSDKLGFKLADLDEQFTALGATAKQSTTRISALSNKLREIGSSANKFSTGLKKAGNSANDSGNKFHGAHNQMSMMFRSLFTWGIIFPMIIKGFTAIGTAIGSSLMVNQQFANSFNQIKSNLFTAFMPIYQAVLPALNSLMSALATATAYMASFVSQLFGTTYNASFGAAKALQTSIGAYNQQEKAANKAANALSGAGSAAKKAAKDARSLAGFDEINQLQKNKSSDDRAMGSGVVTPITPMANMAPIEAQTSKWVDKFKGILDTIFQPFKNAWAKDGAGVMAEFHRAVEGTKNTLKLFGEALATPQVQLFLENIGRLALAIVKLGLRIYDGFILPVIDWFIKKLPGAADGVNPILSAVTNFVNYLSGDGFKYVQTFLALFTGWKATTFIAQMVAATGAIIANTAATVIDKAETLYLMGLYAKDAVVSIGKFIAQMATATGAIIASTAAKVIDKAETLYLMGIYAKDVVVSIGKSVIAWGANALAVAANTIALIANKIAVIAGTIAIGAWNLICGIATIATTAFGVAVAFLTSPIGLVILAIGALIAVGVLLYKHWDTVKSVASSVWDGIKNIFSSFNIWMGAVFATDWSKRFGAFGDIMNGFLAGARGYMDALKSIFNGVIDFISGVFTGNWSRAINGIKEIFVGIFSGLANTIKAPLNAAIGVMNAAISKINDISIDVPDWIPGIGGKHFGGGMAKIPYLARGGVVDTPTLAMVGEAGKEAVMPLENNTGWINNLAGQISGQIDGKGSSGVNLSEITDLLKQILKALSEQSGDVIFKIGESEFARIAIAAINKRRRQTGVNELII